MRIVIKHPGKNPYVGKAPIDCDLTKVFGSGTREILCKNNILCLVAPREIAKDYPINFVTASVYPDELVGTIVRGPAVFVGINYDDLTDAQVMYIEHKYGKRSGDEIVFV